jgi:hydrogenase-1 operon protein HyaF
MPAEPGPNVFNAPALLPEINERLAAAGQEPYAINLTQLPHTQEDLAFLDQALGPGRVAISSRGYGNCRISATGTRDVWWVQFFDRQGALALNRIEIIPVPEAACATAEDIADSAARLEALLEQYR